MEGGLEILRYTLLTLDYSSGQIQHYIDTVRGDAYEGTQPGERGYPVLDQLLMSTRGVEIAWLALEEDSPLLGQTLAEANVRSRVGASVVAIGLNAFSIRFIRNTCVYPCLILTLHQGLDEQTLNP